MIATLAPAAMSIPAFPAFRGLRVDDRAAVETITGQFPPYSDVGFGSLWAWDTDQSLAISLLEGNLVIRFKAYGGDKQFYSFIGCHDVIGTTARLLDLTAQEGLPPRLRLVPRAVVDRDERIWERFVIAADRDNDDYVYESDAWAHFLHPGFREHRRKLARCRERHALEARDLDPRDPAAQQAMMALGRLWASQKTDLSLREREDERVAMRRIFDLAAEGRFSARGFVDGGRLVAFSLWESLPVADCAVVHFQKADRTYRGLSSWQAQDLGRRVSDAGYRWINFEQDLGIPGLREFKRALQPCRFLRKYTISARDA